MTGQFFINGQDAYTTWGVTLSETGLSALMTPAPNKAIIENRSRLQHGKRVITDNPKKDDRDLTLVINLTARSKEQFLARYASFCQELAKGRLDIKVAAMPGTVYRMDYQDCQQFSEFMFGIAKFSLRLNEPNPEDRGEEPAID